MVAGGADRIFGDAVVDVQAAIASGNAAPSLATVGEFLQGNAGDDTIVAGNHRDVLGGGEGDDLLVGGGGDDLLTGDLIWTPVLTYKQTLNTWSILREVNGTSYNFGVVNANPNEFVYDYNGAPSLFEGGADTIHAGTGNDGVLAGGGDDFVDAGPGDDIVAGHDGNDTVLGGDGNDLLDGGDFGDTTGNDFLDGGDGDDTVFGADYDDVLYGGAGDDVLRADEGNELDGADYLDGEDGNDTLLGGGRADRLLGGAGNDVLWGDGTGALWTLQADDYLDGGDGNDALHGGGGSDTLIGGAGVDALYGDAMEQATLIGADYLSGGAGADTLVGAGGADTINGGDDDDLLYGDSAATPEAAHAADQLDGGLGDDQIAAGGGDDFAVGGAGEDVLWGEAGNDYLRGDAGNDILSGDDGSDTLLGGDGNDSLYGGVGNDLLSGGLGADYLDGGAGDDTYMLSAADMAPVAGVIDSIVDTSGNDVVVLDAGIVPADVVLYRTSGTTTLHSSFLPAKTADSLVLVLNGSGEQLWVRNFFTGLTPRPISEIVFADGTIWNAAAIDANTINQGGTANGATGTAGNDSYTVDHPSDTISESAGAGTDSVTSSVTYTLPSNVENLTLSGVLNTDATGNTLVNTLTGNAGDNYLHGGGSELSPDGADTLIGGAGNDTYEVFKDPGFAENYFNDVVTEAAGGGYDTIIARSHSAVLSANVEALIVRSFSGSYTATTQIYQGNALDNVIDARTAALTGYGFRIDGGAGADVMIGPTSVNFQNTVDRVFRYVVDNVGDVVIGAAAGSSVVYDLVQSSVSYVMPETVERLELTGSAPISGTGNALANYLNGSTSSGANVLTGREGNDEYTLGVGDTAVENTNEGTDTLVMTYADAGVNTYDLAQFANFENLTVTDGASAIQWLIGDGGANQLVGNSSANTLVGGAGNDGLTGGAGNDSYRGFGLGSGADTITDTSGIETVVFEATQNHQIEQLAFARVGNDLRIGINAQDSVSVKNWFVGTTNVIEYLWLTENDLQFQYTKAQIDARLAGTNSAPIVYAPPTSQLATATEAFSFQLGANTFSDVESQHSLSYVATRTNGSALPTWLAFNAQTRTFSGTPALGDAGSIDVRVTATDAGSLSTNVTFTIAVQIPPINGTAGNDNLVGDNSNNVMNGFAGNDTLQGLGGNDELFGGADNDTLQGGQGDDYAEGGSGNDTLQGGDGFDDLSGDDGDDQLDGGADDDELYGWDGNDWLEGGTGADALYGGLGNDTYVVDSVSDFIEELPGEGTDTVRSTIAYTLGADLENLTLLGSNTISGTGNGLANVLDGTGNSAANTLSGGGGNDAYYVGTGDTVSEGTNAGTDTVYAGITYTITDTDIENLVLTGTGNINGTGNSSVNTITGNSGNNTLSGGTGADTMLGGAGNDSYTVDNAGDVVMENAGEGTDAVTASVTYTITDVDVENLTLATGSTNLNATGNSSNNVLTGNSGINTLTGLGGNDTLDGGAGNDTLIGGQGDDTYIFGTGDTITELSGEGIDLVQSGATYTLGNHLENLTLTTGNINGTGNSLDNVLIGTSGTNTLTGNDGHDTMDGLGGTDTMVGGLGNDVYYVDVSGDVTTESANQGIDTIYSTHTRSISSLANIELLFLTTGAAANAGLTGNSVANILRGHGTNNALQGNGGTDFLEGLGGDDTLSNTSSPGNTLFNGGSGVDTLTGTANKDLLIGGVGNDAITTGQGADIIVFNQGEGADTVASSTTKDNVLSLGGGILYADLLFQKSGNNLILKAGGTDQITFTNYYSSSSNRSVDKLQIVIEGTTDYDSGSGDALRNKKIATFDFDGIVAAFDAALVANPGLTNWALTNALVAQHLGGSDTAAIGGDLAYRYGRFDTLSDISFTPAVALLAAAGFGTTAQTLQALGSLQDGSARLS